MFSLCFFIKIFDLWILWKTAKVTKGMSKILGAAVYAQNPQVPLIKTPYISNYSIQVITDEKVKGVVQKSGRAAPRRRSLPKGDSPVRVCPVNFSYFIENPHKLRRAHLYNCFAIVHFGQAISHIVVKTQIFTTKGEP
jgi:hypothetical protein